MTSPIMALCISAPSAASATIAKMIASGYGRPSLVIAYQVANAPSI
jgi:hypothetical protein